MPSIPQFYPTEGVNMELPHTREGNRALLEKLKQDHRKSQETGAPESAAN
eukprot:CAMPEP_0182919686 /NCGR_PEP_ID=MMETSP0105_2-20130417/2903_1 /TAXON_ID=81532 ORGANISM="Acanthoeca-like sp., Strain 10tr" /NCGR_SAMPLE_ID=MMETSP0105_2 /ASSEMBLY_ACC=CAM_ASM_000205 /LENGTH=49 /DNA_ID=CAMNT_0025056925 /DNA_START=412 /DNA_END=561 /DNA_ORIENTATION=-